jgi:hypothetical protein
LVRHIEKANVIECGLLWYIPEQHDSKLRFGINENLFSQNGNMGVAKYIALLI